MIRYALRCEHDHEFEAWFSNSAAFDEQKAVGLIECPHCGSLKVEKAIMAPMVRTSEKAQNPDMHRLIRETMTQMRKHVEQNFAYVGDGFAKEARDMHEGTAPERPIYGQASPEDIKALVEEGVPVAPVPPPLIDVAGAPVIPKALPSSKSKSLN
jgi:hypothetical protein